MIGTSAASVKHARELLELVEAEVELTDLQCDWYLREFNDSSLSKSRI